jgi:hypothetical protein
MRIIPTITALLAGVAIGYVIATPGRTRGAADLMREMHNAGYRKGIQHAALGLLEPAPSTRVDAADERNPE